MGYTGEPFLHLMPVNSFLRNRLEYLATLHDLAPGWIAGGGVVEGLPPSRAVCTVATSLLTQMARVADIEADMAAERLIMGPLVPGGVALEFTLSARKAKVFVSLWNSAPAELAIFMGPGWQEFEAPLEQVVAVLLETLPPLVCP